MSIYLPVIDTSRFLTAALFAGGDLDEHDKEVFLQSIMDVYRESKDEAREIFSPKKRASRKPKA